MTVPPETALPTARCPCRRPRRPELTVRGSGTGSGKIVSSPAGIECPGTLRCLVPHRHGGDADRHPVPRIDVRRLEGAVRRDRLLQRHVTAARASRRSSTAPARLPAGPKRRSRRRAEREPYLAASDGPSSFYNTSTSANGDVRTKTIFNPPSGFCYYATSDTGGVFLERRTGSGWISEGELTAPPVGTGTRRPLGELCRFRSRDEALRGRVDPARGAGTRRDEQPGTRHSSPLCRVRLPSKIRSMGARWHAVPARRRRGRHRSAGRLSLLRHRR